jgi:hypothetical protein
MRKVETKSPAQNIIGKLGGLTKTAALLSSEEKRVAVSTVQGWQARGKIPQEWWMPIMDAAKGQGVEIDLPMFLQVAA